MKKCIAVLLLPVLALVCVGFLGGCSCGGEAGGKVAGNVSASDQVYPWAGPSSTSAK